MDSRTAINSMSPTCPAFSDVVNPIGEREGVPHHVSGTLFSRNLRAFGYDMYGTGARKAMDRARDNAELSYSEKAIRAETKDDVQAGILTLPRLPWPISTVEQREALVGWVYNPMVDTGRDTGQKFSACAWEPMPTSFQRRLAVR